jgi:hypothetical protein
VSIFLTNSQDLKEKNRHTENGSMSQLELVPSSTNEDWAFDEMNLVEIPFCLLQNTNKGKNTVPLSASGLEYIESSQQKYGLPTALAEPVVLGLMWLSMSKYGFNERIIRFSVRELVEKYMYPNKYMQYRAGGKIMAAVEEELHRIAATRLYSKRWYDKKLGRHVDIDASIIDYISVINEGGKNSLRVLEVGWGTKLMESVQARYTKNLDVDLWLQIEHPLDRRMYRWLDRQLSSKERETVKSCQNFARFKLLMQGKVLDKGGRTASTYIFNKLSDTLERLNGLGFAVRMTPDKSKPDFSLIFDKIPGKVNEVVDTDPAGDLVRDFQYYFHGLQKGGKKYRLREADVEFASKWIESYGYEQSRWMLKKCRELHSRSPRSDDKIYYFKGLEAYEPAASSAFETHVKEVAGQQRLRMEETRRSQWGAYEDIMLIEAEKQMTDEKDAMLRSQAREQAKSHLPLNTPQTNIEIFLGPLIKIELKKLKLTSINAMPQDEFESYKTNAELDEALIERHGYNPLKR